MGKNSGKAVKNSTKLFFSGVVVLTIANLLVKVIGLLFKIPMNAELGGEGLGYYNAAYQIYTVFFMVSTAGLPVAVSILISESRSRGELKQIKKIFRTTVALFFGIGFLGMAAMYFGAKGFADLLGSAPTYVCIMAIAPTLFFICVSSTLRGYFQGFQQMIPTAISELIEALCKLILGILFARYAVAQGYSINVVAAYAAIGLSIGAGLGMVYLFITKLFFSEEKYIAEFVTEGEESTATTPTKDILKRVIIIALPITLSATVMSLTNLIDTFIVQNLLQENGMSQAEATTLFGNYTGLAVPMFNLPPVLIYPISAAIVPLLSVARTQGDKKRSRTVMESALKVAVLIGVPCGLGMSVLSRPILEMFYSSGEAQAIVNATPLLRVLAPSTIFVCILSVTNAILQSCGKERLPLVSMLAGAAVKLVTNYFLIQHIGMIATPISTFLCYLTVTCINFVFIAKYADIVPNIVRVFLKPFICGIICAAAALGSYTLFNTFVSGSIATVAAIGTAGIVYVLFVFLLRVVTADDVKLLPKGNKICSALTKIHLIK